MSIKTRTIFVDNRNNQFRFLDWCLVNTTLGTMVEPFQFNRVFSRGNYDPLDICAKITNIGSAEQRQSRSLFNNLCGGQQVQQEYSY